MQAILRRMPRQFEIPMPQQPDRLKIINILLKSENVDWNDVTPEALAALTDGYSGSDLKVSSSNKQASMAWTPPISIMMMIMARRAALP